MPPFVPLKDQLFKRAHFGEKVPENILSFRATTPGDDDDVFSYYTIGRNNKGEIGKYDLSSDGKLLQDLWCYDAGRSRTDNEILVSPFDKKIKFKWEKYQKNDPLPPHAFHAGWNPKDGVLYIGKAKGSIGKIDTTNGKTSGKMANLWIHQIGCVTAGQILTAVVVEGGEGREIIEEEEEKGGSDVIIKPFLLFMFGYDNDSNDAKTQHVLDFIGFTEDVAIQKENSTKTAVNHTNSVKHSMDVGEEYTFPYGYTIEHATHNSNISSSSSSDDVILLDNEENASNHNNNNGDLDWIETNSKELSITKSITKEIEFPAKINTEYYRWAIRFKGGQVISLPGNPIMFSNGKNRNNGKTKHELELGVTSAILKSWDGGYNEY